MIKKFAKERKLELICDLHGHSRRMDIFMYGCNIQDNPAATRAFPLLLSKLSPSFNYKSCSFHMQKSKESTLRMSMFKEINIPFVYTLEASFCGGNGIHYTVNDLMNLGKQLCLGLLINGDISGIPEEIHISKSDILTELTENEELLQDNNEDTSGSESEPSEDNLDIETLKTLLPKPVAKKSKKNKKNHLKTEKKMVSPMRKRESLPAKSDRKSLSIDKKIENKKCLECGEIYYPNHICVKKTNKNLSPSPILYQKRNRPIASSFSSLSVYVNFKGKKVRDQATQTMYIRKLANSDLKNAYSLSLINAMERTPSPIKNRLEIYVDTKKLKKVVEYEDVSLPTLNYQLGARYWNLEKSGRSSLS